MTACFLSSIPYNENAGRYAGGLNRNINITNVNVTTIYRNARVLNGISGVAVGDFTAGRFSNVQRVSGSQVQAAGLVSGRVPLNPGGSASRRFSDRTVTNVPRPSANTQFFSRNAGQGTAVPGAGARPGATTPAQSGYHRFGEPGGNAASQNTRTPQAAPGGNAAKFAEA